MYRMNLKGEQFIMEKQVSSYEKNYTEEQQKLAQEIIALEKLGK